MPRQIDCRRLLRASSISLITNLVLDCSKLRGMTTRLRDIMRSTRITPTTKRVHIKGAVYLADAMAAGLHIKRFTVESSAAYDPRFVVFEFIRSMLLRKQQVKLVKDFVAALTPENLEAIDRDPTTSKLHLAHQMLMGQGKTAVITPLLCLLLADGKRLPIVLLPEALLEAGRGIVRSTFNTTLIQKQVYTLVCSRAMRSGPKYVTMLDNAKKGKGVIMTTPSSMKSVILKFIDTMVKLRADEKLRADPEEQRREQRRPLQAAPRQDLEDQITVWVEVLRRLSDAVLIIDELDWVAHPLKSELNFPIGFKTPLDADEKGDGWTLRWEVPLHILDGMFAQRMQMPPPHLREDKRAFDILGRLSAVMQRGYNGDYLQRQPHTILLDTDFYRAHMRPVLTEWMVIYLQAQELGIKTNVPLDVCVAYLNKVSPSTALAQAGVEPEAELEAAAAAAEAAAPPERARYVADERLSKLSVWEWKLLNLTASWLDTLLPHCLQKVNRVSFGMMRQGEVEALLRRDPNAAKTRTRLAIPFVGKDVPSPAAEFAQPDCVIGLTVLAYERQGLRKMDMLALILHLQNLMRRQSGPRQQRPATLQFNAWIKEAGAEVCGVMVDSEALVDPTELLQLKTACLHLDSRAPESSSGALGDRTWRDLSGSAQDVDLGRGLFAKHGGYYELTGESPLRGVVRRRWGKAARGGLSRGLSRGSSALSSEGSQPEPAMGLQLSRESSSISSNSSAGAPDAPPPPPSPCAACVPPVPCPMGRAQQ